MKHIFISITLFFIAISTIAQEEKSFNFKLYGFVRNDFYYEDRQGMESAGGLFFIIPKDKLENEIGEDLNATSSSRLLSIVTRVGLNITGPDVLGAKSSAKIETDLSAFTGNTAALRLRQAWAKLSWDKTELLVGQAWHPMFGDLLPTVMSLGTGCPFQPFNRSPQIRFDYKFCNKSRIYLSALYQMQYNSIGPNGSSAEYLTNGILPELFLGSDYKTEKWLIGAGVDFMRIRPRLYGEKIYEIDGVETNIKIKVSDYVSSFSAMAFAQYKNDKLTIKAKTILGQNLSNQLMLSGYGVSKIKDDGSYEYTNINTTTSWLNITYGKKVQVGIFGGYTKNLGTSSELLSEATTYRYGFKNIDQVYRVAPQISYNLKHWTMGVEYEMTTVAYGDLDLEDGKVKDTHNVTTNRIAAVMIYKF